MTLIRPPSQTRPLSRPPLHEQADPLGGAVDGKVGLLADRCSGVAAQLSGRQY